MVTRRNKTKGWLRNHQADPFVRQAQKDGYRSRAAYKLIEIDDKDRLLYAGATVVDLGAAPGGWSQVAAKRVGPKGKVYALDVLAMETIVGVDFVQGDFREDAALEALRSRLDGRPVQVVLSDMAPNISGVRVADQAKAMYLAELALMFTKEVAGDGASGLFKVFQGAGCDEFRREMASCFQKVTVRKPKASKDKSREFYLLGNGFHV